MEDEKELLIEMHGWHGWHLHDWERRYYRRGEKRLFPDSPTWFKTWQEAVESAESDGFTILHGMKERVAIYTEAKATIVVSKQAHGFLDVLNGDERNRGFGSTAMEAVGAVIIHRDCGITAEYGDGRAY
jgi:hypothetical protein